MADHVKPTVEELDANADKALEEAEALKNEESHEEESTEKEHQGNDQEEGDSQKADDEEQAEEEHADDESEKNDDEKDELKKKVAASTRESQRLLKNVKAFESAVDVPEPTEEELVAENPEWDTMSSFEQKMAKKTLWNDKRFAALGEVTKQSKDLERWQGLVHKFVDNPQSMIDHPELEGKQEEFEFFATAPNRINMNYEDLVAAFLYNRNKDIKPKKGKMFETGTGGPNNKAKSKNGKLSLEQGRQLRNSNYEEWKRQNNAGNIESI